MAPSLWTFAVLFTTIQAPMRPPTFEIAEAKTALRILAIAHPDLKAELPDAQTVVDLLNNLALSADKDSTNWINKEELVFETEPHAQFLNSSLEFEDVLAALALVSADAAARVERLRELIWPFRKEREDEKWHDRLRALRERLHSRGR